MAPAPRNRPYLVSSRPLSEATTTTRSLVAVAGGDEDQVPLVRPYLVDPAHREGRRAKTRVRIVQTEQALALLGLMALVQDLDRQEAK